MKDSSVDSGDIKFDTVLINTDNTFQDSQFVAPLNGIYEFHIFGFAGSGCIGAELQVQVNRHTKQVIYDGDWTDQNRAFIGYVVLGLLKGDVVQLYNDKDHSFVVSPVFSFFWSGKLLQ